MKLLYKRDLMKLKWGDTVHRFNGIGFRKLRYVGRMPSSSDRYLIFSDGEYLDHLYIDTEGNFRDEFYGGEYDSKFVGNKMIEALEKRIESTKEIYIED